MLFRRLWFWVLAGMAAGAGLGFARAGWGVAMAPLSDAFVALVRMIVGPVIFLTVVHGIAAMNDMKRVGRVALKALVYFEVVTFIALIVALAAVDIARPGASIALGANALKAGAVPAGVAAPPQSVIAYLLHIIPKTFASAFVDGDVLQVLFVAVLFAVALTMAGEKGKPVLDLIGRLSAVFFRLVGLVMWAAPFAAFGAMAFAVGKFGGTSLYALGALLAEFYAVCLLFTFVVLGAVAWACGANIIKLLVYIREELLIVAATTSSETVLPRLVEKMQAVGCEESVVGLVIPASYSFNLDGTCLYLATATMFLAQANGMAFGFTQQLGLLAVMLLTSKGAAGVAGAAIAVLVATASSAGIPLASVALVLGIHRLMAEALTFVNVVGDCVATIAIAKWEGALDEPRLRAAIGL